MSRDTDTGKPNPSRKADDLLQRVGMAIDTVTKKTALMTVSALADALGVKRSAIYKWRDGENAPAAVQLIALCEATGCDPGWLLTGRGEPFPTVTDDRTATAMEAAFVSLIRQAGHSADAVVAIEPFVGREAIRSKITPAEIRAAARSLRDAGGQLLGLAGPPGEDE